MAKVKTTNHVGTVASAVTDAFGEIESLKDELQSWYDNLHENFQNGQKGEELTLAIEMLEQDYAPDVPTCVEDRECSWTQSSGSARRIRRDNCVAMVEAAINEIDTFMGELEDLQFHENGTIATEDEQYAGLTEDNRDAQVNELGAVRDELDTAKDNWEQAEFPGMY